MGFCFPLLSLFIETEVDKMKRIASVWILFFSAFFLMTGLTSCNQSHAEKQKNQAKTDRVKMPDSLYMSKKKLAQQVQAKARKEVRKKQDHFVKEGLESISETNATLKLLDAGNTPKAEKQLDLALHHARTVLKKDPETQLIPINISVNSRDFVAGEVQVEKLVQQAKKAMSNGYYQKASGLLDQMKSEVEITTVNLPLTSYPKHLEKADSLLKAGQTTGAANILYGLLNSLEINQVVLPIPVLRAEALIAEAQSASMQKSNKKKTVNLLENADYQLQLAKDMGYGNFDKEYDVLSKQIQDLEQQINNGKTKSDLFSTLSQKVDSFKERLFGKGRSLR